MSSPKSSPRSSKDDSLNLPFEDSGELAIDPAAFESARLTFVIKNTTTHTEVKKGAPVELVEFLERGAILEIPSKSCSRGHNLMIKMRLRKPTRQEFEFSTTAKVDLIEAFPEAPDTEQVTVTFLQYDEDSWQSFQKHFFSRQDEIESFLKAAKGI